MRIGPYELLSRIGKGGMGEVWKACDTRVNRIVAIKFSQASFDDRFAREARAIAALNHPNICTLYDVGPDYLVMEFVEGEPIQGPLPIDLVLRYAAQILDALDHAHRRGIVHRDLKPPNILVTRERLKLLDFGLAKFQDRGAIETPDETVTSALTGEGTILGTLHYMAPEQLEGRTVDERSDIFAVGCLLYELITGKRPFDARSAASQIAAILEKKPEPLQPEGLNSVIEICLAKNPEDRWQNARDLRHALELNLQAPAAALPAQPSHPRLRLAWSVVGLMTLIAAAFASAWFFRRPPESLPVRFTISAPPGVVFNFMITATAVSPDARFLVFRAASGTSTPALWLRPLDSLDARLLPGTEGADFPFWSPDAKSIGFFAQDKLKKIDLTSAAPQVLCDAFFGSAGVGGTWNRDGVIVFADKRGLFRIPESGGASVSMVAAKPPLESGFGYPQFLPDGKHILFFLGSSDAEKQGVYATSLDAPLTRIPVLKTSTKAIFAPPASGQPARLLYARDRNLLAVLFNSAKLRAEGDSVLLAKDLSVLPALGGSAFWLSDSGLLVYRSGSSLERLQLVWRDRNGRRLGEAAPENSYTALRLSPDGNRVAIGRRETGGSELLWTIDLSRGVMARLTAHTQVEHEGLPAWSPDGRQVAFSSIRNGLFQIFRIEPDSLNPEQPVGHSASYNYLTDWSRDGRYLLYDQGSPGAFDIWARPVAGSDADLPVLQTPYDENGGQFSPDGNWVAYSSNASGRYEVYIMGFPGKADARVGRWQISSGGGRASRWRGDGHELYYLTTDDNKLMAVTIRTAGRSLQPETPRELFATSVPSDTGDNPFPYDIAADGRRFLVEEAAGASASIPLTAIVNWHAGLKK